MNALKYILVVLVLAAAASTHLEGEGKVVGDYKIELSTLPSLLSAGKNSDIVIAVENATTGERISGAEMWIRLSSNGAAFLASPNMVTDRFGVATINYVFQQSGAYTLDISFRNANTTASFDMTVGGGGSVPLYMAAAAAVFFVVGLAVGFIFFRRPKK